MNYRYSVSYGVRKDGKKFFPRFISIQVDRKVCLTLVFVNCGLKTLSG